jgi:glutathione synthase/RimK-type ligase-like ATP-grasp enzyme
MHIALLGDPDDLALAYMMWLARRHEHDVLLLNESSLGVEWDFTFHVGETSGVLRVDGRTLPLDELAGMFVRLHPEPALPPGLSLESMARVVFVHERREALHHLLDRVPCPVVNRPSAGRSNASKPLQMAQLTRAGFDVPAWVVTNSLDEATRFVRGCPHGAVYKATSGLRSRVRAVDDELRTRLRAGTTPTLLQEYVAGRDVRVHTVADEVFATEVESTGVDYRFESQSRYRRVRIDSALARQCCEMARRDGLLLAGFDFRVTPQDEWRCLEMNPVPSFLPYEMASGDPIGAAILDLLERPRVITEA